MTIRAALIVMLVTSAACQPTEEPFGPMTTTASTISVHEQTTTSQVPVDSSLIFAPVDTGVAESINHLDRESFGSTDEATTDRRGDTINLVACRTTWFGRFELEFEWAPSPTTQSPSTRKMAVVFAVDDVGSNGALFEVKLREAGRFVVPVSDINLFGSTEEVEANTRVMDRSELVSCHATYFGDPVTEDSASSAPLEVAVKPPLARHGEDSIQSIIEQLDPTDTDEVLRPLAALAGFTAEFPVNVVYVIPGVQMSRLSFDTNGACLALTSSYGEIGHVVQHAGCFDGRYGGDPVDDVWTLEISGDFEAQAQPLTWVGHPGVQIPATAEEYLDQRELPEGETEVLRAAINGTLVSVIRYQSDDTTIYYLDGLGDGSGGGGFPGEVWNGCFQVEWKDSGYSMVVVGDPEWDVIVSGTEVDMHPVDDVAIAVVPTIVQRRDQLQILTTDGEQCLDG